MTDDWKARAVPNVVHRRVLRGEFHTEGFDADDYNGRPPRDVKQVARVATIEKAALEQPGQPTYRLTLPLPPSANDLVRPAILGRTKRGKPLARLVKTREAKPWHDTVRAAVAEQLGALRPVPLRGPLYLTVTWYLRTLSSDSSNRLKALEDGLTAAGLWHDDCQVVHHEVDKDICGIGEKPSCVVRVGAYWHPNAELRERYAQMKKAGGGR